jgi:iron complex transport system ATP-binding protein
MRGQPGSPLSVPQVGASGVVLDASGLKLALAGRAVVRGVDLELQRGSWCALVGPNGAGKSSLLRLLAGLQRPDGGVVRVDGRSLSDWPDGQRAQRIAWLAQGQLQGHGADADLSVRDVVRLGRLPQHGLFGAPGPSDEAAVDDALRETACADLATRRLAELSGGERQRVLLARALAVGASVLLLDEPTTHLDPPHLRRLLQGLLRRARQGAAVLTVLHDVNLALAADRVLVMNEGRLVADGPPADPALHQALTDAFEGAFDIRQLPDAGAPRWVALTRM